MARGEETVIFGDGEQQRDFVYVGDIVAALLAAVGRGGGPFNIGTGIATSVNELHARLPPRGAGSTRSPRTARRGSATSSAR